MSKSFKGARIFKVGEKTSSTLTIFKNWSAPSGCCQAWRPGAIASTDWWKWFCHFLPMIPLLLFYLTLKTSYRMLNKTTNPITSNNISNLLQISTALWNFQNVSGNFPRCLDWGTVRLGNCLETSHWMDSPSPQWLTKPWLKNLLFSQNVKRNISVLKVGKC